MVNTWNAPNQLRDKSHINLVGKLRYYQFVGVETFAITDTKLYVLVVTLSSEDNAKLLKQLDLGLRRIITSHKHLIKMTT